MNAYAQWLLRHRLGVLLLGALLTAALAYFAAGVKIVIDPAASAPQGHPYIVSSNAIADAFGSKYLVVIGLTPKQGDVFQPEVIGRVDRITQALTHTPGVVSSSVMSLTSRQTRLITASDEGFRAVSFLDAQRAAQGDSARLRAMLAHNPLYQGTVVSADGRTTSILLDLQEDARGFSAMLGPVQAIVDRERSPDIDIALGGNAVYLDLSEAMSQRIGLLFAVAVLVIGLLHYEAFRSLQGLILPLVTALVSVVWGMGIMGLAGQQMDVFNSPTPILILAVAAGHAVQLLKRYYEEYDALREADAGMSAEQANRQAVVRSLVKIGPVMVVAGGVAAAGFLSLLMFNIPSIRAFGLFTGLGIASALVLEMTVIPAMRSMLRPPALAQASQRGQTVWDRVPRWIGQQVIRPGSRAVGLAGFAVFAALCAWGSLHLTIDNEAKRYFAPDEPVQQADRFLNQQLGGTNSLYVMVDGGTNDAIEDPLILRAIEGLQREAEGHPWVGKTFSLADHVRRMHQAMHGDDPAFLRVPEDRALISQYLFLYSLSGGPDDFNAFVDAGHRRAKVTVLLKTDSNEEVKAIVQGLQAYAATHFGPNVRVSFGGDVVAEIALTDTMVKGKLLNIAQILTVVFLISAWVFRSIVAGLVVLVPLVLATLAVFGVMGGCGIPLNIPNSLIAAMAVGIGADYAIYFLYRLREHVRAGTELSAAVVQTLATAGKASMFVAAAVAGGYAVLLLSLGFRIHQWLSVFIVLAMVVSLLGSLVVVPSLVLSWRPSFVTRKAGHGLSWPWWVFLGLGLTAMGLISRAAP